MHVPPYFAADDATARRMLADIAAADLVTSTSDGLVASFLPLLYEPALGDHGALLGHLARANAQWSSVPIGDALVIARGPDAYVSPSWYASTAEHGRVVPTWDYEAVHVHGELVVHDDPAWIDALVRRLTDRHEAAFAPPWSVDDAPAQFIEAELRAIVGIEVVIHRVEAKRKWSQNRPARDVEGVLRGFDATGQSGAAAAMRAATAGPAQPGGHGDPAQPGGSPP